MIIMLAHGQSDIHPSCTTKEEIYFSNPISKLHIVRWTIYFTELSSAKDQKLDFREPVQGKYEPYDEFVY